MSQPNNTLLTQATKWFLRMKDAAPDHAERGKFEAWLMSSEANRQAYQKVAETWQDFDSSESIKQISNAMLNRKLDESIRKRHRTSQLAKFGAVVIFSIASLFLWHTWQDFQAQPLETIAQNSDIGQMVSRTLTDGSKLMLDSNSRTEVVYYRDKRYVRLLQGQAVFEVVKDANRPFVVESNHARVTVKGTRFVVNMLKHKTVVAVDHGKVQVETMQSGEPHQITLTDGQVAEIATKSPPVKVYKPVQDYFAFLQGKLIFDGASIDEVTETLSRYYQPALVNQSHVTAEISAVVDIKSVNTFIKTLPSVAPVKIKTLEKQTVVLDR